MQQTVRCKLVPNMKRGAHLEDVKQVLPIHVLAKIGNSSGVHAEACCSNEEVAAGANLPQALVRALLLQLPQVPGSLQLLYCWHLRHAKALRKKTHLACTAMFTRQQLWLSSCCSDIQESSAPVLQHTDAP